MFELSQAEGTVRSALLISSRKGFFIMSLLGVEQIEHTTWSKFYSFGWQKHGLKHWIWEIWRPVITELMIEISQRCNSVKTNKKTTCTTQKLWLFSHKSTNGRDVHTVTKAGTLKGLLLVVCPRLRRVSLANASRIPPGLASDTRTCIYRPPVTLLLLPLIWKREVHYCRDFAQNANPRIESKEPTYALKNQCIFALLDLGQFLLFPRIHITLAWKVNY